MRITRANVGALKAKTLPELRNAVNESNDAEHLMFSVLFRRTEASVRAKKSGELKRVAPLVHLIFQDCEQEIRDAVAVSFLENIDPDGAIGQTDFQWVAARNALDQYMQRLIGKSCRDSVARNA
jgi:hypothetical protein